LFLRQPSNPGHDRKELRIHRAAGTHNLDPIAKVSRETFFFAVGNFVWQHWRVFATNTEIFCEDLNIMAFEIT
jgi:hypothetical protein